MVSSGLQAMVTSDDVLQLVSAITLGLDALPQEVELSIIGTSKAITLTYGASTLLAESSSSASGRKQLIVRNEGRATDLVGPQSSNAIHETGLPVEPGETKVFRFHSASVDLYARAMGYKTRVSVWEV